MLNELNAGAIKIVQPKNAAIADYILKGLRAYSAPYLGTGRLEPFLIYMVDAHSVVIGGIVGAIRQYPQLTTAWVHKVWVAKNYRRCGLGTKLFAYLDTFAYHKGCANIQLEAFDFQGKLFYEKQAFEVVGKISKVIADRDKFFMRKTFNAAPAYFSESSSIFLDEKGENEQIKQIIINGCNVEDTLYLGAKEKETDFSIYLPGDRVEAIGGMTGKINNYEAWVNVMWVDERYTGQGIGKMLWRKLEEYIRDNGRPPIFIGTFSVQAKLFYEKVGCKCQGTITKWLGGYDQHWFEKRI